MLTFHQNGVPSLSRATCPIKSKLVQRPRGILLDYGAPESGEIDGLPVYKPEEVLKTGERIPVVLFSVSALAMARKIKLMRPDYQRDELVGVEMPL